jgi:hypothetical protein
MALDLTKPIDITLVNAAVVKHKDVLKALDMLDVQDVLKDCTPMPGVTDSLTLGKVEGGTISSKYSGVFIGDKNLGKIVPRKLMVYPVVAEMADEPERYRRAFIADVAGGLWDKKHPFEVWIIQHGINLASQDLHDAIFVAAYDTDPGKTKIEDSFDGWGSILMAEKTNGKISASIGNLFATGALTRVSIGDKLLEMYRKMPKTFRKKQAIMWISEDIGDMYDDWLKDETIQLPGTDESGHQYLKGTNKKCRIKRTNAFPEGSQFVLLTTRANMVYGFDKMSNLTAMKPFNSGNPYLFTAAMKYIWGTQFISIHPSELMINDQPLTPAS